MIFGVDLVLYNNWLVKMNTISAFQCLVFYCLVFYCLVLRVASPQLDSGGWQWYKAFVVKVPCLKSGEVVNFDLAFLFRWFGGSYVISYGSCGGVRRGVRRGFCVLRVLRVSPVAWSCSVQCSSDGGWSSWSCWSLISGDCRSLAQAGRYTLRGWKIICDLNEWNEWMFCFMCIGRNK